MMKNLKFKLFERYEITNELCCSTFHASTSLTKKEIYKGLLRSVNYLFSFMRHEIEGLAPSYDLAIYRVGSKTISGGMIEFIDKTTFQNLQNHLKTKYNLYINE